MDKEVVNAEKEKSGCLNICLMEYEIRSVQRRSKWVMAKSVWKEDDRQKDRRIYSFSERER